MYFWLAQNIFFKKKIFSQKKQQQIKKSEK